MLGSKPEDVSYRYARVGRQILELVEAGTLKPGDRVPSLRNMSSKMHVSITTVSQAYVELESQGVIESRPKSGFFVRPDFRKLLPQPAAEREMPIEPREVQRGEVYRTVTALLGRTDILSFGMACLDTSLLPSRELGRIMTSLLRENAARTMGYEMVNGNPELRKQIAFRCIDAGAAVMPDDVIVTTGAMEAISIAIRCITRPGDIVVIQSPAYYVFLQLLDTLGLRAIEIPSRPDGGIHPGDLAEAVNQYDVKACVLNPNFNNPDGSLVSDEDKEEIVRILAGKSIPLIEDDVSGDIHFGPARPCVCKKYDKDGLVMLCSSFSKTIAPGYRVGWLIPGKFYDKALTFKVNTSVCSATPTQAVIAEFLRTGKYERHLKRLRAALEKQMHIMQLAVSRYFPPGTKVTRPAGGALLWVELPGGIDSREYFFRARAEGIGVVPGPIFSTFGQYGNFIRLTCCGLWNKTIEKGIERLGQLAVP